MTDGVLKGRMTMGCGGPPAEKLRHGSCAVCGATSSLRCAGCRETTMDYHGPFYCGKAHQKADWQKHKARCLKRSVGEVGIDPESLVFSIEPGGRHRVVTKDGKTRELTEEDLEAVVHVRSNGAYGSTRRAGAPTAAIDLITVVELSEYAETPTYAAYKGLALTSDQEQGRVRSGCQTNTTAVVTLEGAQGTRDSMYGGACLETWRTNRADKKLRVADLVALVTHRYQHPLRKDQKKPTEPCFAWGRTHRVATLDDRKKGVNPNASTDPKAPRTIRLTMHVGPRPTYMTKI